MVFCVPSGKALAANIEKPFFQWVDIYGRPLTNGRYKPYSGGVLVISDVRPQDTQRMKCIMSSSGIGVSRSDIQTVAYDHTLLGKFKFKSVMSAVDELRGKTSVNL